MAHEEQTASQHDAASWSDVAATETGGCTPSAAIRGATKAEEEQHVAWGGGKHVSISARLLAVDSSTDNDI